MPKVAIACDSNSGITQDEAKALGIRVLAMPFYINDDVYYEGSTLTRERFFEEMSRDTHIYTSQPAPAEVTGLWDELLKRHDEVVYIPMSSGLSGSCETAMMLARDYEGKVYVVNNQRVSVTQRQSVMDAIALAKKGMTGAEIAEVLIREKMECDILVTLDTLKYLKKGGRITPATAAIGTILNLKPVLTIRGEKPDAFAKARGWKSAKKIMLDTMEKELRERFAGKEVQLAAAYSCTEENALEWKKQIEERFPGMPLQMDPLSLSLTCHIGPGSMGIACAKRIV